MKFEHKRWVSLFAGVIVELCFGALYAWSVLPGPLSARYGWGLGELSITFTLAFVSTMLVTLLFGKQISALPIRKCVFLGCAGYAVAMLGCGLMWGSVWELYLFYGVLHGGAIAFVYPTLITYGITLFPDRPGFAGGAMTAGYGLGGLVWASLMEGIYSVTGNISMVFFCLAVFVGIGCAALSALLFQVPEDFSAQYAAERPDTGQKRRKRPPIYDTDRRGMLKTPLFYVTLFLFLCGLLCGTMVFSQGSLIAQGEIGMNAERAALVVSALSLASATGRFAWGTVSDAVGRPISLILNHGLMAASMFLLLTVRAEPIFLGGLLLTTLCYGGFAGMLAPAAGDIFGARHRKENYSVLFCTFGLSSTASVPLIAFVKETTGSFKGAFLAGGVIALAGFMLAVFLFLKIQKVRKENAAKALSGSLLSPGAADSGVAD